MDYTHAIKFIFKEPDWPKKLLIPGLIALIPIFGIIHLIGWACEVLERTSSSDIENLPQPFSLLYLKDGAKLFIGGLLYYIPLGLIYLIIMGVRWLVVRLLPDFLESVFLSGLSFLLSVTNLVYLLAFLFIMPALIYVYLENSRFRDLFDFKRIYLILKKRPSTYLSLMVALGILIVLASAGISVLFVGIIFTMPYAFAVYANLLGQSQAGFNV